MKLADDHYLSDDEEVHTKYITSFDASKHVHEAYMGFP